MGTKDITTSAKLSKFKAFSTYERLAVRDFKMHEDLGCLRKTKHILSPWKTVGLNQEAHLCQLLSRWRPLSTHVQE